MNEEIKSNFYFENYLIDKINLKVNEEFNNKGEINLDFDIDSQTEINMVEKTSQKILTVTIWDNAQKNNYPFSLEISIIGFFSADDKIDEEEFKTLCKYNSASILFPFLRSAIADITRVSNVKPLTFPLINVLNFIDDKE